jgi:hypothetical protein
MSNLVDQLEKMRSQINGVAPTEASPASTPLTEQLDHMRIRMNELARRESQMVSELNASIRRMDNQLLHEVRSIAAEHETRTCRTGPAPPRAGRPAAEHPRCVDLPSEPARWVSLKAGMYWM